MKITEANILVFDTETTGIDTANDRIVELGAVALRAGAVAERFHAYVHPTVPIPQEVTAIHGIDDARVADAPTFAAIASRVAERFAAFPVLCGYNAAHFDAPLLNAEWARAGFPSPCIVPWLVLDPVVFVRWHLRGERDRKLTSMCQRFGIPLDNAHTAAADAEATALLLLALVREGLIPDDVDEALAQQARFASVQADEGERWSYWLYTCREDGETVRLGAGKHCGSRLADVDHGFLRYVLRLPDIHVGAREAMERELRRRAGGAA